MDFLDTIVWNNSVRAYLLAASLFAGSFVVAWVVTRLLRALVIEGAEETRTQLDDLVADVGARPIALIIVLAGLHVAVTTLLLPPWLRRTFWTALVVAWTVVGAVFAMRVVNGLLAHYVSRYAERSEEALYLQLTQTIRSTVNVAIWLVAAVFVVSNLGFNVSSILAGLGLGGLALALAAKDTLANIFGSFTILINGPFRVGEAVTYQGHTGKVERVGLRSTHVRTFDGHLVVVPNALAPTSVVENISRRPSFRCLFQIHLRYDLTQDQLDQVPERVTAAVAAEPGTTPEPKVHVLELGQNAVQVQVLYYIEDQDRLLDIRHAVNRRIKQSLQDAGIRFAHQTVTVEQ